MESSTNSAMALWTTVTVTVNGSAEIVRKAASVTKSFFREIRNFEKRFSRFLPDSEVWIANENVGKALMVTKSFAELWHQSETMRSITDGYFDARIENALAGWWYRSDPIFSKGRDVIEGETFETEEATEAFESDARIDFWGIGKGRVLDLARTRFEAFENVCVVAGGDVFVKWLHVSGKPFSIALEHPLDPEMAIGEIRFADWGFVAGSSANRRSWGNGRWHIVNPLDGSPANGMLATFVHAREWWLADAWATAFFAMGFETAQKYVTKDPRIECLFVSTRGEVFKSAGFLWKTFT